MQFEHIMASSRKYEISYFTATILNWKFLLRNNDYKNIIIGSLKFLAEQNRILLHAFVLIDNHIHLLWHVNHPYLPDDVQRDFLKYTAQMIIKDLRNKDPEQLKEYYVGAKDRKHQIWERNPLTIEIWSEEVLKQKLEYVHMNPVKAGLCTYPEDYHFSSAAFYLTGTDNFEFISSCLM